MDDVVTTSPVLDLAQEDLAAVLGALQSYQRTGGQMTSGTSCRIPSAAMIHLMVRRLAHRVVLGGHLFCRNFTFCPFVVLTMRSILG